MSKREPKLATVDLIVNAGMRSLLKLIRKRRGFKSGGRKPPVHEVITRAEPSETGSGWVEKERVIDREAHTYSETVFDASHKTIRQKIHPLRDHRDTAPTREGSTSGFGLERLMIVPKAVPDWGG